MFTVLPIENALASLVNVFEQNGGADSSNRYWYSKLIRLSWDDQSTPRSTPRSPTMFWITVNSFIGRYDGKSRQIIADGKSRQLAVGGASTNCGNNRPPTGHEDATTVEPRKGAASLTLPKTDKDGKENLFYKFTHLVNLALDTEITDIIENGNSLLTFATKAKSENKSVDIKTVYENWGRTLEDNRSNKCVFSTNTAKFRQLFDNASMTAFFGKHAITVKSIDILTSAFQTQTGANSTTPFQQLENPLIRIKLNRPNAPEESKNGGSKFPQNTVIYNGLKRMKIATVNGQTVTETNVHQYLKAGCPVKFVMKFGAVCFHQTGISKEFVVKEMNVFPREERNADGGDGGYSIHDNSDGASGDGDSEQVARVLHSAQNVYHSAPTNTPNVQPAPVPTDNDANFDDLLNSLEDN